LLIYIQTLAANRNF